MLQLSVVNFKERACLRVEGMPDDGRFFIIQAGTVNCFRANDTLGEGARKYGPGDFVGIISCFAGHSQIETCMAMTNVTAIAIRKEQFPELIRNNTPVALKIIRTLSARMRVLNGAITRLTLSGGSAEITYEHIFEVADFYDNAGYSDVALYAYFQYIKACPNGRNVEKAKNRFNFLRNRPTAKAVFNDNNPNLILSYPKDTMVFAECQDGVDLFIIQEGQIKLTKIVDGNEMTLTILRKGDMFGEMALLENKPRSASAISYEDCKLMAVNKQNFNQMVSSQPQLILRITTTFTNRIWSMYKKFDNANFLEPLYKLVDMLAIYLEETLGRISNSQEFQTDLTQEDLASMCGIPKLLQEDAFVQLGTIPVIKLRGGKIFVTNCMEVIKQAAFYHHKNDKMQEKMKKGE